MAGNFNRSEFFATFKAEVDEHLNKLSKGLVRLEKKPDDFDLIKDLFRTAHTLKGVARMMGFFEIQEISHRIEDIFSAVTDKRLKFVPKIASIIFEALDSIKSTVGSIAGNKKVTIDVSSICSNLELCLPQDVSIPEKKSKKSSRKAKKKEENAASPAESIPPPQVESAVAITASDSEFFTSPSEEYIRVPLSRINKLLNLLGEMVINKIKASDRKSTRLNSSHIPLSRMPSSA